MIKLKVMMTLNIDPEDYPIPSDGKVDEEIEEYVREAFHDIEGVEIKHMKLVSEDI